MRNLWKELEGTMPAEPLGGFAQKITPGVTPDHLRTTTMGPPTTAALMTAFAGRRMAAEGKRRFGGIFGGIFGTGLHNRAMKRGREAAAKEVASRGQFSEAQAAAVAANLTEDQIYAAARTYAVQCGDIAEDADEETWWSWFKTKVLPVMWDIAKILAPLIISILIMGS